MFFSFFAAFSFSFQKKFKQGEAFAAYFGNVGLKRNPFDEVFLDSLSFYRDIQNKEQIPIKKTIADYLLGNNLKDIGLHFNFEKNFDEKVFITKKLESSDVTTFKNAVAEKRYYHIYVDDILSISKVGKVIDEIPKIYTKMTFNFGVNNGVIVQVFINMSNPIDIESGQELKLSFGANFFATNRTIRHRKDRYLNKKFFESKFHKTARYVIIAHGALFILLVFSIIKQMIADFDKQNMMRDFDDFDLQASNDRGWKILHGDVFRPPHNPGLLSMIVGFGLQIAFVLVTVIVYFYICGTPNDREGVLHTILNVYTVTAVIAGCVATAVGSSFGQKKWLRLALGSVFFPPLLGAVILASLSILTKGPHSISITVIAVTVAIASIPLSPLATIGGWFAKRNKLLTTNPSEIALVPRTIPTLPIYLRPWFLSIVTGVFIGATVLPEFYFYQAALWKGNVYYTYSYLLISLTMALVVSACASICWTFIRLQNECYSWHWLSFGAPASISVFVFCYSIFFFIRQCSSISISAKISYFACSLGISLIIGVACGSTGFIASNTFVRTIFSNLKLD